MEYECLRTSENFKWMKPIYLKALFYKNSIILRESGDNKVN
jgi:hypothetical protein